MRRPARQRSTEGGSVVMPASGSPSWPQGSRLRRRIAAWSSVWLLVLGAPAGDIFHGRDRPAAVGVGLLIVFAATYLRLQWRSWVSEPGGGELMVLQVTLGAWAVIGNVIFGGNWTVLFFLVAASAGSLPRGRVIAGVIATTVVAVIYLAGRRGSVGELGGFAFGVFMSGIVVWFIRRLVGLVNELWLAREQLARMAVRNERLRFSRDMHDLLGRTVSLIVVKSELVGRLIGPNPEAAAQEAVDIQRVGRQALAEIRQAARGYRLPGLEDELAAAADALSSAGIELSVADVGPWPPDLVQSWLGWGLREAVTNVVRHSGATRCRVEIGIHGDAATLVVTDNGRGCSASASDGSGILGLAERLAPCGGTVEARPVPEGGFRLVVRLPLPRDVYGDR
jgi:two-component system sensor histidine kinase DesK